MLRLVSPTLGLEIPMPMPRFLALEPESIEAEAKVHVPKFIHAGLRISTLETSTVGTPCALSLSLQARVPSA